MMTNTLRERVSRLAGLLAREREAMAEFIADLADFDLRRCWEALGYPSLFEFLVRELRLSRGNAFYRTKAVDLVRRFPDVLEALRQGKLCITTVPEIARVLTPENRAEVLPRFFHLSRDDAKLLAVELVPREVVPVRESITEVGQRPTSVPASLALAVGVPAVEVTATLVVPVHPLNPRDPKALDRTGQIPAAVAPEAAEPMTDQLSRLHLSVSRLSHRRAQITFPPRSAAPSGNGTAAAASGRWRTGRSAARGTGCSSTTSSRRPSAARPPSRTFGSSASVITCSLPSRRSGRG